MKKYLSSKSRLLCVSVTAVFCALAVLIAFFDTEPLIAFIAVMILSLIVLVPLYIIMMVPVYRAFKQCKIQENEMDESVDDLSDSQMIHINDHISVNEDWIVQCALGRQFMLHKHFITSIHEGDKGLELYTELREKPFVIVLSNTESGTFEKERILHWYDPLYEIPLEDLEFEPKKDSSKKHAVLLAGLIAIICAVIVMFVGMNMAVIDEPYELDDYIYFSDYLKETSQGSLNEISYEVVKSQDEVLMYVFNETDVYVDLELDCYDSQDEVIDTAWPGIIRPHHYTSVYIDEVPDSVRVTSSWFYTFDYHVPSFQYDVEYARREYNVWVNAVLDSSLVTLENVIDLGIHEYAIEEMTYTGADCVYVYDVKSAVRSVDKVSQSEMLDPSTALYRIDFELYDYRIQIYELSASGETHLKTIEITQE